MLEQAKFVARVERRNDETMPKDGVITTVPAGKAPPDSTVTLIVSDGPAPRSIQNVARKTYDQAAAALQAQQLLPQRADAYSDTVPSGQVIRTEPAAGQQVARGSTVQVVVSKGTDAVLVPDLRGLTIDAAAAAAAERGLTLNLVGPYRPNGKIGNQDPVPGTRVRRGQVVKIAF
jgi:serine/threonine-protein kinase